MNHDKVLIVEDEENERTGLAELINGWGYRAETAKDGAEGLEKVTAWAPSIVITDMKMPRMGGLELLEKLATDTQTMAVVVVTAQGTIDSAVQAMRMGAYDYITKPIDTNRLRTILANASALLGADGKPLGDGLDAPVHRPIAVVPRRPKVDCDRRVPLREIIKRRAV